MRKGSGQYPLDPKLILYRRDGCHIWLGSSNSGGYGQCAEVLGEELVHRAVWTLAHGPPPRGTEVMHICDNRLCMNLAHLRLGTHLQNQQDMARKGRAGHARLTPEQVIYIKKSMAPDKKLVQEFSVSKSTIRAIRKGRTWKL